MLLKKQLCLYRWLEVTLAVGVVAGYLLDDGGLHASLLHLGQDLLLQHHLLLRLDDVLGSVRRPHHLQDLTWGRWEERGRGIKGTCP